MPSFKKFIHTSKQGFAEKFGKAEKTIDDEYDFTYRRFDQVATATVNYNKHVQQFIENFHSMSTTLTFIAEDLTDLYKNSQDQSKRIMAEKIMKVAEDIDANAVRPFQDEIVSKVVTPLAGYIEKFEQAKVLHKQRAQTLQEHDYYKNKVKKLMDKQSKDPMKLPQNKEKYNRLREDLDAITVTASAKFTEIIQEQPIVFDPITDITLNSLLLYWERVHSGLSDLKNYAPNGAYSSNAPVVTTTTVVETRPLTAKNSFSKPVRDYTSVNLNPLPMQRTTQVTKSEIVPPKFKCEWYYLDSTMNQTGPVSYQILKSKYLGSELNDQSFVFGPTDLTDWKAIGDYSELKRCLSDISSS